MNENSPKADDVEPNGSENRGRAAEGPSSSRRQLLLAVATAPVILSIKARSAHAQAQISQHASSTGSSGLTKKATKK
jgi:hypothetical protein